MPNDSNPAVSGLEALEARIARDLSLLNLPSAPWVPARQGAEQPDFDVIVIGAGMLGLCAAAGLRLRGMESVVCLDRAPEGREGPWLTYARMETLRTPKSATGPALGIPGLTFRAWFEAQFGPAAWERLDKIPRPQWMDYLRWYRAVLRIPVRNDTEVTDIAPRADGLIDIRIAGREQPLRARRAVLATGIDGLGGPSVPAVAGNVSRRFYAHSADDIDFSALRGRRVGVVGAGASAMDNAAAALEAGAATVDLFVRRPSLPAIDKFSGVSSDGFLTGYVTLPDAVKWRIMRYGLDFPVPAPSDSARRVFRHPDARLRLGSPVLGLEETGGALTVTTPHDRVTLDFLIFATGFACAPERRPELARIAPLIRRWGDRFPTDDGSAALGAMPDLAGDFSFRARNPEDEVALSRLYCFNFEATLSHGKLTSGAPGLTEAAERLVRGIASSFVREEAGYYLQAFETYNRAELKGDEWRPEQVVGQVGGQVIGQVVEEETHE